MWKERRGENLQFGRHFSSVTQITVLEIYPCSLCILKTLAGAINRDFSVWNFKSTKFYKHTLKSLSNLTEKPSTVWWRPRRPGAPFRSSLLPQNNGELAKVRSFLKNSSLISNFTTVLNVIYTSIQVEHCHGPFPEIWNTSRRSPPKPQNLQSVTQLSWAVRPGNPSQQNSDLSRVE